MKSYFLVITKLLGQPVFLLTAMALYNYNYGLLIVLECTENLSYHILDSSNVELIPEVVVEQSNVEDGSINFSTNYKYLQPKHLSNVKSNFYLNNLKTYLKLRTFHSRMHQIFFLTVSSAIISLTLGFPVILVFYDKNTSLQIKSVLTLVAQGGFLLGPVLLSIGVDYRRRYILNRFNHEVLKAKDTLLKKALRRFISTVKDPYPNTSLCLFELDSELLLYITDFVFLIATALFSR